MDTLIGICGKDFVAIAADTYEKYSLITIKNDDESKIMQIGTSKLLLLGGPRGDRSHFGELIKRSLDYYKYKNSTELSTKAAAHFVRLELADYLRKSPYQVDMIVAGYDKNGPELFWIDYLACCVKVETAAHGYGGYLLRGLLDREYHPDITEKEAVSILRKCRQEIKNRFLLAQSNFVAKIIDADGIHDIDLTVDETRELPEIFQRPLDVAIS